MKVRVTTKQIRKWCREQYGALWWDVDIELRKERKLTAKRALLACC
jgi:hypothetical protein